MNQSSCFKAIRTALAVVFMNVGVSSYGAEPTLDEAVSWITRTVNESCRQEYTLKNNKVGPITEYKMECQILSSTSPASLRGAYTYYFAVGSIVSGENSELNIPLRMLDPTAVIIEKSNLTDKHTVVSGVKTAISVTVYTTNKMPEITGVQRWLQFGKVDVRQLKRDFYSFPMGDEAKAIALATALRHAIKLAGGKPSARPDLFK